MSTWQWFRLPRPERARRVAAWRAADEALDAHALGAEGEPFLALAARVDALWPTVPWWWRR